MAFLVPRICFDGLAYLERKGSWGRGAGEKQSWKIQRHPWLFEDLAFSLTLYQRLPTPPTSSRDHHWISWLEASITIEKQSIHQIAVTASGEPKGTQHVKKQDTGPR